MRVNPVMPITQAVLLASSLALTAVPEGAGAEEPGFVVFSEIMWMGSGASSADEWIELYNRGTEPVDLAGWTVTRATAQGDEAVMITIDGGTLAPGATFLIANYAPSSDRSQLAAPVQLVSAAVALPNTKLLLRLYDAPEGGRLVDIADDGRGRPLGGATEPPASMVREIFGLSGALPEAWSTATESSGWRPGAAELGTPGSLPTRLRPPSQGRATGVSSTTWSQVKVARFD